METHDFILRFLGGVLLDRLERAKEEVPKETPIGVHFGDRGTWLAFCNRLRDSFRTGRRQGNGEHIRHGRQKSSKWGDGQA